MGSCHLNWIDGCVECTEYSLLSMTGLTYIIEKWDLKG
jgi:hypothetical protein